MTAIPTKTRKAVRERDEDRCFMCGMQGSEIQHRMPRRDGGHRLSNLIRICKKDHREIHAHPAWAYKYGYSVSRYSDPAEVPVRRWDGAWVLLDDDGGQTIVDYNEEE